MNRRRVDLRLFVSFTLFVAILIFAPVREARGDDFRSPAAVKLLPNRIGEFVADGAARPALFFKTGDFNETAEATREYRSSTGEHLYITIVVTNSDSSAYALLTSIASAYPASATAAGADPKILNSETVGAASYLFRDCLFFYKGPVYAVVGQMGAKGKHFAPIVPLARGFADLLDKGEGEVPALAKHLPGKPNPEQSVRYAVNAKTLARIFPDQPVLPTIGFEGGTEVVTANYGTAQLVIAEFTTPQLASDNDWNIKVKIQELASQGKLSPTVYRRVGNYSVFVLNAPNEQTANQLIDQVKYEQVVQWLGDNPNWLKQAQKEYTETTLGVLVTVVKTSGLAAVLCFGIGGLFGGLLFARRRAQQTTAEAYTDAGGMMRLNLDELSAETNSAKLIGSKMSDK